MTYLLVKALHIIAVISWMAGLLYLPRLLVYHADAEPGSQQSETFKVMERRLLKAIMTPAMAAAWILGLFMLFGPGTVSLEAEGWIYLKLALVVTLSGYHGFLARCVAAFAEDANTRPARFYRWINEVPTLLMIAIVVLAVMRPF